MLSEKIQSHKVTYCIYYSSYITFLKGQNFRNSEQISGCQGLKWEGGRREVGVAIKATQEIFVVLELFAI